MSRTVIFDVGISDAAAVLAGSRIVVPLLISRVLDSAVLDFVNN